jgi:DNA-binding NtrC family response regulator
MNQPSVLVFESAGVTRDVVWDSLVCHGFKVTHVFERSALTPLLRDGKADLVVLGQSTVNPANISELVQDLRHLVRKIPILLLASHSSEALAIAALRAGINEYLKYPVHAGELADAVKQCLAQATGEPYTARAQSLPMAERGGIIGESAAMRDVRARIAKMAPTDSNILVTGETGTGKELVAESLHNSSPRYQRAFVTINCAAIPDSLLESELFGYEKGAFTGADSRKEGKLKTADGGTVLLDEIGDMSAYGQAKILRMIEAKEIQRLGRDRGISVDVRIVAATNQDLDQLVKQEKFRKDLFFRLSVARIHLPPLRERKEDLLLLVDYYIRYFNSRFGRNVRHLSEGALDCLLGHDWPGNIRELKNLLEAIFVELPSGDVSTAQLPPHFSCCCAQVKSGGADERERLLGALSAANWNKSRAADKLHWSRMTLYRKMARYNISQTL